MFEVWDRVTGNFVGDHETREEAEDLVESLAPYQADFIIIDTDED